MVDKISDERLAQLIANAAGATDETWWLDDVADALTELQHLRSQSLSTQQPMGEVRVKALEWIEVEGYSTVYADTIIGSYSAWDTHFRPPNMMGGIPHANPKQGAYEHFRNAIISALHPNQESGE